MNPILELHNIRKVFPGGVLANDNISFDLLPGEIHALLGENGAGKSTLMNILYGLLQPDSGEIIIKDTKAQIQSPRDAIKKGIGMVHQHFMLVPTMNVTENIMLGRELAKGPFLSTREAQDIVRDIATRFDLRVAPDRKIWELSVGERQRVEILKALYHGAEILVLDEPTAVLTPYETESLFQVLHTMVSQGISIIFITHKMEEVFAISDRISVLRRGSVVGTTRKEKTSELELAKMMIGRELALDRIHISNRKHTENNQLLSCEKITVLGKYGQKALKELDLEVLSGEIVGIAGVDGNGQSELAEVVAGLRPLENGRVIIDSKPIKNMNPLKAIEHGIAYIPVERKERGSIGNLPLTHNLALKNHRYPPFSNKGVLDHKQISAFAEDQVAEYDVRCPNIFSTAAALSGGNLQKLIFAREIALNPKLVVADRPTRGLDIAAIEYIRTTLIELRDNGVGVLLISSDLDEILALSDRIIVLYEGETTYTCSREMVDIDKMSLAMTGEKILTTDTAL